MRDTRPIVVVMLKVPRLGRVKTRLGADIGSVAATWWFRHQVKRLLRTIDSPKWRVILAVAPDQEILSRAIPHGFERSAQGFGDLGARMKRQLTHFAPRKVLVIGADIPSLNRKHIASALDQLGRHDFVFGPADDGGFWCVGSRNSKPMPVAFFADVRWSSEHALSDSLATLGGKSYGLSAMLNDVDTASDLQN